MSKLKNFHDICNKCAQPMAIDHVMRIIDGLVYHTVCPQTDTEILYNLAVCMRQTPPFIPEFCREHFKLHGERKER